MFWSAWCSLLRAEGFSCSLGVLYGYLGISKWQFLIKEIKIQFQAVIFYFILGIKPRIRDPDPESGSAIRKNAGSGSVSGSALNQCGSETMYRTRTSEILSYACAAAHFVYKGRLLSESANVAPPGCQQTSTCPTNSWCHRWSRTGLLCPQRHQPGELDTPVD